MYLVKRSKNIIFLQFIKKWLKLNKIEFNCEVLYKIYIIIFLRRDRINILDIEIMGVYDNPWII